MQTKLPTHSAPSDNGLNPPIEGNGQEERVVGFSILAQQHQGYIGGISDTRARISGLERERDANDKLILRAHTRIEQIDQELAELKELETRTVGAATALEAILKPSQ